jgi:thymidylate kinase
MSAPALGAPPAPVTRESVTDAEVLSTVRRLADALVREAIPYCHWKSNAHLRESAEGTTDLDLLVDRAHAELLAGLLARLGFKRFAAVPWHSYAGVEDYLALDRDSGRLVHLHLHHELTLGERHLKGYRLPWEHLVLASGRRDPSTGLLVADPTIELLLLLVRGALKLRTRDRWPIRRTSGGLDAGAQREYRWLYARADPGGLSALALHLLGPRAADAVGALGSEAPTPAWLRSFRRSAQNELGSCRTYAPAGARVRRVWREFRSLAGAADRRWLRSCHRRVRTDPRGGVVVAFVGCDGAGKSTLVAQTTAWLSWKLDTMPLYLGSGDGAASPLRWPLRLMLRLVRLARQGGRAPQAEHAAASRSWAVPRAVWALVLSREKRRKLAHAVQARNRGMIVVCDRYPQAQVLGFNDGPLLGRWREHRWALIRAMARWESAPYEWAARHPPDLVIKLLVSPAVTLRRKPGMRMEDVQRRVDAVRCLQFAGPARVVEIDADAPLDQVSRKVKQAIWERL